VYPIGGSAAGGIGCAVDANGEDAQQAEQRPADQHKRLFLRDDAAADEVQADRLARDHLHQAVQVVLEALTWSRGHGHCARARPLDPEWCRHGRPLSQNDSDTGPRPRGRPRLFSPDGACDTRACLLRARVHVTFVGTEPLTHSRMRGATRPSLSRVNENRSVRDEIAHPE